MKTNDEPLHLDKSNPYSQTQCICIYTQTLILIDEAFKYGDGETF
jgi:hypothetical protein